MELFNEDGGVNEENLMALVSSKDVLEISRQILNELGGSEFAEGSETVFLEAADGTELTFNCVHDENNGDGREAFAVVEIQFGGESLGFVRIAGTFSSYAGTEWEEDELEVVHLKKVSMLEYLSADGSEDHLYVDVQNP